MNPEKSNKQRNVLLFILGVVVLGVVGFTVIGPMMAVRRAGSDSQMERVAVNAEAQVGGTGAEAPPAEVEPPLPDGSAVVRPAPDGVRRDPFHPLPGQATAAKPGVAPKTAGAGGSGSGPVPVLPAVVGAEMVSGAPGLELPRPERKPEEPMVLMGTALGMESVALFRRGNEILERKVGDYVYAFRITAVQHGRVKLVDEQRNEPSVEPGQQVFYEGVSTAPSQPGARRSAAAGTVAELPSREQPLRVAASRWPSTVR